MRPGTAEQRAGFSLTDETENLVLQTMDLRSEPRNFF